MAFEYLTPTMDLTLTVDLTFGSHTSSDAGRSFDPNGYGTLGLDLLVPTHKEVFLEEPNLQEMDGQAFSRGDFLGS